MTTTYQHVWGYFKKIATDEDRLIYKKLLNHIDEPNDSLGPWLATLAQKYQIKYLLESHLIKELLSQ